MNDDRRSEIIYEEGWRENVPVTIHPESSDEEEFPAEDTIAADDAQERPAGPLLLTLQLAVCLLLALAIFLLKAMGSGYYDSFMAYYRAELQKPVISERVFDAAQLSRLFSEKAFTVQATPDETAPR